VKLEKKMIAYKVVVRCGDSRLRSAWMVSCFKELETVYKPGSWTFPKMEGTPLYVFKTIGQAREFISFNIINNAEIWQAEIVKSKWKIPPITYATSALKCILRLRKNKKKFSHLTGVVPHGTVLADQVKLLERVK
jgi:hypothetical protein